MTQSGEPDDGAGRGMPEAGGRSVAGSARVPGPRPGDNAVQHSPPVAPGRASVPVPHQPGRAAVPAPAPAGATYDAATRQASFPVPVTNQPPLPPQPPPTTYGGGPAVASAKKRRTGLILAVVFLVIALLGGGGAAAQLTRDLPAATLTTQIAATLKIPGTLPKIPWPSKGSAELMIEGLGRIGGSSAVSPR